MIPRIGMGQNHRLNESQPRFIVSIMSAFPRESSMRVAPLHSETSSSMRALKMYPTLVS